MAFEARQHVPALTGLLSAVSLALIFGAVLGVVPSSLLPRVDGLLAAIPHVNAAISAGAILVIASGWRAIRRGDVASHRRAMLAGIGMFAAFLLLYLYRVSLEGPTHFDGPAVVGSYLYLPLLAVHVSLAVICVPLLYYVTLLALTRPVPAIVGSHHARVGRVAVVLWLTSFALGIVVYLLLYWLF